MHPNDTPPPDERYPPWFVWSLAVPLIAVVLMAGAVATGVDAGQLGNGWRWTSEWTESSAPTEPGSMLNGSSHTAYLRYADSFAPYARPIGLSVTAPDWLRPAIYDAISADLKRILPQTTVHPIAQPQPGAQISTPIVTVYVHRADRRWRPLSGSATLQATVLAVDPVETRFPATWPADAFSLTRNHFPAIAGYAVVSLEDHVSITLSRTGFEMPNRVTRRLAARITGALMAQLTEQLQEAPGQGSGTTSAAPSWVPTLPALPTLIAGTPPPSGSATLVNTTGLTGDLVCNGKPVPAHLAYSGGGWLSEFEVDYKLGGTCRWRYRLSNPSAHAIVDAAIQPAPDGPHQLLGPETLLCADPQGARVPCSRFTVPAGSSVDVMAEAQFRGCFNAGPKTGAGGGLSARVLQPGNASPAFVWLHDQLLIRSPLDDLDCPARLPAPDAVDALKAAIAPRVREAAGDDDALPHASLALTITDVSDVWSGSGLTGSGLVLGNQVAAFVATTGRDRCVGWFAYERTSEHNEPTGPDVPRAFTLRCALDDGAPAPLGVWAPIDTPDHVGGGAVVVGGLDGLKDGVLSHLANGTWDFSADRIQRGVANGGVWPLDDASGELIQGTLTFRIAADMNESSPAQATFFVPESAWLPMGPASR